MRSFNALSLVVATRRKCGVGLESDTTVPSPFDQPDTGSSLSAPRVLGG